MSGLKKRVLVSVPASIGNVGPGFDVLGMALDNLLDHFNIGVCTGESRIELVGGVDAADVPLDPQENLVTIAAEAMSHHLKKPSKFSVSIERQLPISGGLGSSAAASLAGSLGAARLLAAAR